MRQAHLPDVSQDISPVTVKPGFPGANTDMPPLKQRGWLGGLFGQMRAHPPIVSTIGFFRQRVSRCLSVPKPRPVAPDFPKTLATLFHI